MYKNFFDGFEAIIFDLDGTVVNDEFVWERSIVNVFSKEIISENPYYGERGQNLDNKIYRILQSNSFKSNIDSVTYYELVLKEFFKNIHEVEIKTGFEEFATFLKEKGKKLVLVTNSDARVTSGILEKLNLKKYFDLVISVDEVEVPKPAPFIYELAIEKLKIKKEKILVFEDSVNGALAAENAGLKLIIVLPDENKMSDYGSKNRLFIDSFETILDSIDTDADTYLLDMFSK
jgi:HAD superfamily hydrolase (TIGR01509 family)